MPQREKMLASASRSVRDQRGNITAKRLCDAQRDDPDRDSEYGDHGDVKQIFVCPPEVFQVAPECRLKRNSQRALESRCVDDAVVKQIVPECWRIGREKEPLL